MTHFFQLFGVDGYWHTFTVCLRVKNLHDDITVDLFIDGNDEVHLDTTFYLYFLTLMIILFVVG